MEFNNQFTINEADMEKMLMKKNPFAIFGVKPLDPSKAIVFNEPKIEEPEEWIWVEGYKGTDANMKCRNDYQFELGKQFDMPEDASIVECSSGFHFCLELNDVYKYYPIRDNHRFFKVRALVRKNDFANYGIIKSEAYYSWSRIDKLVAKSIIFDRELSMDEILKSCIDITSMPEKYKKYALLAGVDTAMKRMSVDELVSLGYSEAMAGYITDKNKTDVARVAASQPDLSMDMRVLMIITDQ